MSIDHDDALDRRLDASRPEVAAPSLAELDAMARMAVAAEPTGVMARLRRLPRPVAAFAVLAGVGLAGTGAAAVAATYENWSPWAQDPDIAFTYTLPSGAECEQRLGGVQTNDPDLKEAVREFFASTDVLAEADIEGEIARSRADESTVQLDDGTIVPGGYGTEYYNADTEYYTAVSLAVGDLLGSALEAQGFAPADSADLSYLGEAQCPGADW